MAVLLKNRMLQNTAFRFKRADCGSLPLSTAALRLRPYLDASTLLQFLQTQLVSTFCHKTTTRFDKFHRGWTMLPPLQQLKPGVTCPSAGHFVKTKCTTAPSSPPCSCTRPSFVPEDILAPAPRWSCGDSPTVHPHCARHIAYLAYYSTEVCLSQARFFLSFPKSGGASVSHLSGVGLQLHKAAVSLSLLSRHVHHRHVLDKCAF